MEDVFFGVLAVCKDLTCFSTSTSTGTGTGTSASSTFLLLSFIKRK